MKRILFTALVAVTFSRIADAKTTSFAFNQADDIQFTLDHSVEGDKLQFVA